MFYFFCILLAVTTPPPPKKKYIFPTDSAQSSPFLMNYGGKSMLYIVRERGGGREIEIGGERGGEEGEGKEIK